nr:unnamed protein product [Callosobruchus chinensis]
MDDEELAILATFIVVSCGSVLLLKKIKKKPRRRRWWMVSLNKSRKVYSGTSLMTDLLKEPSGKFENFCRMSSDDFNDLLSKVGPMIRKKNTKWRKAIPANERLAITLRFLATGDSFKSLHYLFKVSPQLISEIVPEVCNAIIAVLQDYVKIPKNANEWKCLAKKFDKDWNFPHCIGSLDGKHIVIQAPTNSGSEFYNYKQYFSVVLMALVDSDYCFIFADCGCQGRLSDGANNELHCPPPEPLVGRNKELPYVFVGDDAFGLRETIMKPFPGKHDKGSKYRIFNYRLSRARRVVENTFGLLANVFRVLPKPMLLQPDKVASVVMTCVLLHNFLRRSTSSRSLYSPYGRFDFEENGKIIDGAWRQANTDIMTSLLPLRNIPRKPSMDAKEIRKEFAEYFITSGKIPWQDQYC